MSKATATETGPPDTAVYRRNDRDEPREEACLTRMGFSLIIGKINSSQGGYAKWYGGQGELLMQHPAVKDTLL